jgi:hypothetical protein
MLAASLIMIGVSAGFWLIANSVAQRGTEAGLALAIVLPPALMTMGFTAAVSRRWPQLGITTVLAGTGLRMLWALVLVARLGKNAERYGTTSTALAEWTTGFYLMTLLLETVLLGWLLNASAKPVAPTTPTPAP